MGGVSTRDDGWGALVLAVVTALAGCGARSGLLDDAPLSAPTVDSGVRLDSGAPRDARPPVLDTGLPPPGRSCRLIEVAPPSVVFRETAPDRVDAPQAVARGGAFDLLATGFHDDGSVVPWGTRVTHALDPAGGLSLALGGIRGAQQAGTTDGALGICFAAGTGLALATTPTSSGLPAWRSELPVAGDCEGLVGGEGVWLAARTDGTGSPFVATFDRTSGFAGERVATSSGAPEARDVAIAAIDGGIAWISTLPFGSSADLGFRFDDGTERVYAIAGIGSGLSAPGIGAWPLERGAAAILAREPGFGEGSLVVVGRDGAERLRAPLPVFDMGGEVTPVLVPYAQSIVVATLSYGDADPQGGALDVMVVRGDGSIGERLTLPTRRSPDLARGGVAIAIDANRILVHWAEWRESVIPEERPEHVTLAWPLECVETD